jgi:hypothetical protein
MERLEGFRARGNVGASDKSTIGYKRHPGGEGVNTVSEDFDTMQKERRWYKTSGTIR